MGLKGGWHEEEEKLKEGESGNIIYSAVSSCSDSVHRGADPVWICDQPDEL